MCIRDRYQRRVHGLHSKKTGRGKDDIDSLLAELAIDKDEELKIQEKPIRPQPTTQTNARPADSGAKRRCYAVVIAPLGQTDFSLEARCAKLRCTDCDRRVSKFDEFEWDSSADYLFFRNFSTSDEKLRTKLKGSRGWTAYCCQCKWQNVNSGTRVDSISGLRWICCGHTTEEEKAAGR
eukprot:TRINITY_DN19566_c0_g1_i4.p1 TRINITY_DN19566_c0_g1~~TRINITY_DN19566_c0_g1_i4.p1  ORF type:complete len:179 (+),score=24.89 TRINITY_DN19566_c0_g1_i4:65-601(+)